MMPSIILVSYLQLTDRYGTTNPYMMRIRVIQRLNGIGAGAFILGVIPLRASPRQLLTSTPFFTHKETDTEDTIKTETTMDDDVGAWNSGSTTSVKSEARIVDVTDSPQSLVTLSPAILTPEVSSLAPTTVTYTAPFNYYSPQLPAYPQGHLPILPSTNAQGDSDADLTAARGWPTAGVQEAWPCTAIGGSSRSGSTGGGSINGASVAEMIRNMPSWRGDQSPCAQMPSYGNMYAPPPPLPPSPATIPTASPCLNGPPYQLSKRPDNPPPPAPFLTPYPGAYSSMMQQGASNPALPLPPPSSQSLLGTTFSERESNLSLRGVLLESGGAVIGDDQLSDVLFPESQEWEPFCGYTTTSTATPITGGSTIMQPPYGRNLS